MTARNSSNGDVIKSLAAQYVSLGSAVAVISALVVISWGQSSWQTGVDLQLEHLHDDLKQIEECIKMKTADRWHRHDMQSWRRELQLLNPELQVPEIDNQ